MNKLLESVIIITAMLLEGVNMLISGFTGFGGWVLTVMFIITGVALLEMKTDNYSAFKRTVFLCSILLLLASLHLLQLELTTQPEQVLFQAVRFPLHPTMEIIGLLYFLQGILLRKRAEKVMPYAAAKFAMVSRFRKLHRDQAMRQATLLAQAQRSDAAIVRSQAINNRSALNLFTNTGASHDDDWLDSSSNRLSLNSSSSMFEDDQFNNHCNSSGVNPANGLPMVGCIDIAGNPWGSDMSHNSFEHSSFDHSSFDHDSISSIHDPFEHSSFDHSSFDHSSFD